jgi:hypothetical protein
VLGNLTSQVEARKRRADLQSAGEEYSGRVEEELRSHGVVVAIHDDDVLVSGITIIDLLATERAVRSPTVRAGLDISELTCGEAGRSHLVAQPQTERGCSICQHARLVRGD